jgi:hypothetical protein
MKTGQKKFDARFGWGVVREVADKSVKVQFAIDVCEYTLEGKDQAHQLVSMASDEKYYQLTQDEIHKYAEFAIGCDRIDMKILNFEDFIKL